MGLAVTTLTGQVFAAGQAVGIKHPVLDHNIDRQNAAAYETAVQRVLAMSDAEMIGYIPDKPVVWACHCPNCNGGSQGLDIFIWDPATPEQMKCKYCGTVYPNEKFPEDQTISGPNAFGETITYPFHYSERWKLRHFFTYHIKRYQREWMLAQCLNLGLAWQVSGKPEYARRAALLLDRIASMYRTYPVVLQEFDLFDLDTPQKPPYRFRSGRWFWHAECEFNAAMPAIYDLVYDSEEFDRLSAARGYDVRERIEKDFIKAGFRFLNEHITDHAQNNYAPGYFVTALQAARVINEPRWAHWASFWTHEMLARGCFYDGMWFESPSYHQMTFDGLQGTMAAFRGYTDPPGYIDPEDGQRFDNLDPDKIFPFYAKARNTPAKLDFPDGTSTPVHDTWAGQRSSPPRQATECSILPGFGHASLGRGKGLHQIQAQLHFSGRYEHSHQDELNLTLYAKGHEMLSDIGYSWTNLRQWAKQSIAHNLVVIDRTAQSGADGNLLGYFPDFGGVSAVEAESARGYANVAGVNRYQRLLVLVPVTEDDSYVVDIFRARGGSVHDWLLHGDASADMTATCNLTLSDTRENLMEADDKWIDPTSQYSQVNGYGCIRDIAFGRATGDLVFDLRYAENTSCGIRTHLPGCDDTEVFLGRSPSVRRCGSGFASDNRKIWDFWMPQIVLRRRGSAPLDSSFAAVHEPFSGAPFITRVERVRFAGDAPDCIALKVTCGKTVDTIISTLDQPPYPERATTDGLRIKGRLGLIRRVDDMVTGLWLVDGELLDGKGAALNSKTAQYRGDIEAATRKADGQPEDAFVTDAADLPPGETLRGRWLIVTHGNGLTHGYELDRIETREGRTLLVLKNDHGLRIEGDTTRELFFPRREIKGRNTFRLDVPTVLQSANVQR